MAGLAVSVLILGIGEEVAAAGDRPWAALPSDRRADARFLSLVDDPSGLSGQRMSFELAVPAARDRFRIEIFDGDTGAPCAAAARPACTLPLLGHWDRGQTPLVVRLYADPDRTGSESPGDRVGVWRSSGGHPPADPTGRWRADPAMPDDDWWRLEVATAERARSDSGSAHYHLVIELEDPGDGFTVSNFKLAADVPFALRPGGVVGFEAGAGVPPNDFPVVYPGYRFGHPFDFVEGPTTFDGTLELFLRVPSGAERLTVSDGDLDHGSVPAPGEPSGRPIEPCADGDDPDTHGIPPGAGPNAVVEGAMGPGRPADDHRFDALRREPCVTYRLVDPRGAIYRNADPSGSLEWERFTISARRRDRRADADYSPRVAADGETFVRGPLPGGVWRLRIDGLDLGNSSFWQVDAALCADAGGAPACPAVGEGCSPGFWKQSHHAAFWPAGYRPGTPFAAVFESALGGASLVQALSGRGGGVAALARQAVAALLNGASPEVGFELGPEEVAALFDHLHPGSKAEYEELKERLERLNERRCPLGRR